MMRFAERGRVESRRPASVLGLSPGPVCHGIATPGHGTATVARKSSRDRPLSPCRAGGSAA